MESIPFSIDPLSGQVTTFHYDHADDSLTFETKVDLQPHIDYTRELAKEQRGDWKGDWHHVASIPPVLWPELEKIGVMTRGGRIMDKAKFRAWLNDRDSQAFRTKLGKV